MGGFGGFGGQSGGLGGFTGMSGGLDQGWRLLPDSKPQWLDSLYSKLPVFMGSAISVYVLQVAACQQLLFHLPLFQHGPSASGQALEFVSLGLVAIVKRDAFVVASPELN